MLSEKSHNDDAHKYMPDSFYVVVGVKMVCVHLYAVRINLNILWLIAFSLWLNKTLFLQQT